MAALSSLCGHVAVVGGHVAVVVVGAWVDVAVLNGQVVKEAVLAPIKDAVPGLKTAEEGNYASLPDDTKAAAPVPLGERSGFSYRDVEALERAQAEAEAKAKEDARIAALLVRPPPPSSCSCCDFFRLC